MEANSTHYSYAQKVQHATGTTAEEPNCLGTKYTSRIQLRLPLGTSNIKVGSRRLKRECLLPPQTSALLSGFKEHPNLYQWRLPDITNYKGAVFGEGGKNRSPFHFSCNPLNYNSLKLA